MEWKGRWRDTSEVAKDTCVFEEEGAPYQCFGLGPERMKKADGGE